MSKDKRILLYVDEELKKAVELSKENKAKAFDELKSYIEGFVVVSDITSTYELEQAIEEKTKDLPSYLSIAKKKELIEFSQSRYESLLNRYNSIEILEAQTEIYATTPDQIKRYEVSKTFIDALSELENIKGGHTIWKAQLSQSLGGILTFDLANNCIIPNYNFILS